ncbi:MAG: phosphotransferase [Actinomycetota bacterium]|nr:phosphotransferase [Actinomycetota bacterium]
MNLSGLLPVDLGARFGIDGRLVDVTALGRGHIHQTWLAVYRRGDGARSRHVHQRLNTSVFAEPVVLMDNLARVTVHLAAKAATAGRPAAAARRALRLERAVDGAPTVLDGEGRTWRTLAFIDGASTPPRFSDPAQAAAAAITAAGFVVDLADLSGRPLAEVIPGFHDVIRRLDDMERAVAADAVGRARGCRAELEAVRAAAPLAAEVDAARVTGGVPERTVHNDAKADNVLFDDATGQALCMVDLDTAGPGTVLFDVGDLVRSGAATGPEDGDAGDVEVRTDIVEAILDAYADAAAGFLTESERALLPLAGPLMTLEAAARFLTDHLRGDVYFRVDGPGHNLARARNQVRVLELLRARSGRR